MKDPIIISKNVLTSLMPQRNLLNAPKDLLLGRTFALNSIVENDAYSNDLESVSNDNGRVTFRFQDKESNAVMKFPIRSILYANVTTEKDHTKFNKDSDVDVMHKVLLEQSATKDDVTLPEEFTIISVEDRKNLAGDTIYPSYSYQKFQDRIAALKAGEDQGTIYADFSFIGSLAGTETAPLFKDIEPIKSIVINIS